MKPYAISRSGRVTDRRSGKFLGSTFQFAKDGWEATLPEGSRLQDARFQDTAANDLYEWWKSNV